VPFQEQGRQRLPDPPLAQSYYATADGRVLNIFFLEIEVVDARFQDLGDRVSVGDPLVTAIKRKTGGISMEITFGVNMTAPLRHFLHYMTGPMRVILDIEKT